jgi:beta-N-acetylhexosaminidase
MCDVEGLTLAATEIDMLQHPCVGGIILFARNYASPAQVYELTQHMHVLRPELLIAVDQEGGRVQRLRDGFTPLPPMQELGNRFRKDGAAALELATHCGWMMASEVRACGIDLSFAPVLDVDRNFSSIIGNRAFSDKPEEVATVAEAFIMGMHAAGMGAVGKHFPGHGAVVADSHLETPIDERPFSDIEQRDLLPFAKLSDTLDGIMPAHLVYTQLCDKPAVFSEFWLKDILRKQLGFKGVIFSDDLCMAGAAMMGDFSQRARLALHAGCDMVLVCNNAQAAHEVISMLEKENFPLVSKVLDEFPHYVKKNVENIVGFHSNDFSKIRQDARYLACQQAGLLIA